MDAKISDQNIKKAKRRLVSPSLSKKLDRLFIPLMGAIACACVMLIAFIHNYESGNTTHTNVASLCVTHIKT